MKKYKYLSALLLLVAMSFTALSQVENPYMIKNINTTLDYNGVENDSMGSARMIEMNETLYFSALSNTSAIYGSLWKTQGHPGDATQIFDVNISSSSFIIFNNYFYFTGKLGNKYYIFKSN